MSEGARELLLFCWNMSCDVVTPSHVFQKMISGKEKKNPSHFGQTRAHFCSAKTLNEAKSSLKTLRQADGAA